MSADTQGGRYRWVVCALLFLATTINYIDRQILSLLKPSPATWSSAGPTSQFGQVNSVFQGAYALSLLFFGWFVDRFGSKVGYAVSIVALEPRGDGPRPGRLACAASSGARRRWAWAKAATSPPRSRPSACGSRSASARYATSIFNAGTNVGAIIAPAIVPGDRLSLGLALRPSSSPVSPASSGCSLAAVLRRAREGQARHAGRAGAHPQRPDGGRGRRQPDRLAGRLAYRQTWSFVVGQVPDRPGLVVLPHLAARLLQEHARPGHQAELDCTW